MQSRTATVERSTSETKIKLTFNIDGQGICKCNTGIPFFDHMLNGFARHGFFDLNVECSGDIDIDCHHTVEDVGIVLGQAIAEAVGGKEGITRFGHSLLPMDEALMQCAVDLSGRPFYVSDMAFTADSLGGMACEMINEFFYAVSCNAAINLHLIQLRGSNNHHIAEAAFKAFGKSLDMATGFDNRVDGVLSTKGSL